MSPSAVDDAGASSVSSSVSSSSSSESGRLLEALRPSAGVAVGLRSSAREVCDPAAAELPSGFFFFFFVASTSCAMEGGSEAAAAAGAGAEPCARFIASRGCAAGGSGRQRGLTNGLRLVLPELAQGRLQLFRPCYPLRGALVGFGRSVLNQRPSALYQSSKVKEPVVGRTVMSLPRIVVKEVVTAPSRVPGNKMAGKEEGEVAVFEVRRRSRGLVPSPNPRRRSFFVIVA